MPYYADTWLDQEGRPIENGAVTAVNAATNLPVNLYSDSGMTVVTTPITDSNGMFQFWAPPAEYIISLNASGFATSQRRITLDVTVNFMQFGADNTGTNDCTDVWNSSLSFLATQGGGTLRIPAGKYKGNFLINQSAVSIVGEAWPNGRTVIPQVCLTPNNKSQPCLQIANDTAFVRDVTVTDIDLYGGATDGTAGQIGLYITGGARELWLERVAANHFTSSQITIQKGSSSYSCANIHFNGLKTQANSFANSTAAQFIVNATTGGANFVTAIYVDHASLSGASGNAVLAVDGGPISISNSYIQGVTNVAAVKLSGGAYIMGSNATIDCLGSSNVAVSTDSNASSWTNYLPGQWYISGKLQLANGSTIATPSASPALFAKVAVFQNIAESFPTALDWYEEGTWVPVIQGTVSTGTATYTVSTGTFTRIGQMIAYQARVNWNGHTGLGNMQLGGLPYSALGGSGINPPGTVIGNSVTFAAHLGVLINNGAKNANFYTFSTGASISSLPMQAGPAELLISGTYFSVSNS